MEKTGRIINIAAFKERKDQFKHEIAQMITHIDAMKAAGELDISDRWYLSDYCGAYICGRVDSCHTVTMRVLSKSFKQSDVLIKEFGYQKMLWPSNTGLHLYENYKMPMLKMYIVQSDNIQDLYDSNRCIQLSYYIDEADNITTRDCNCIKKNLNEQYSRLELLGNHNIYLLMQEELLSYRYDDDIIEIFCDICN
ncbi:LEF-12 [Operophtera brumata nucleopolyhedrovirus]|uniref:LEF-12 n=1 Tax=Operophtera brumata nucleopolyhedrovirus TaxID=1046267 RepID=A0A2H4UZR9_9ABAC|nr:LEF-12 [Operophtera brumata nucleopolyhedrovirus]AUA60266.1 LEF-12 [Operophtera brumata nucleopolyhedrovirus]